MFTPEAVYTTIGDTTRHEVFKFLHERRVGLVLVRRPRDPFKFRALRLYGNPKVFFINITTVLYMSGTDRITIYSYFLSVCLV